MAFLRRLVEPRSPALLAPEPSASRTPRVTHCEMEAYLAWADRTSTNLGVPDEVRFERLRIVVIWRGRFRRHGEWIGYGVRSNLTPLKVVERVQRVAPDDTYEITFLMDIPPNERPALGWDEPRALR